MKLSKVRTAEEIIAQFKDGQIIAIGGQTNQYMPDRLIDCVLESGARHLTIYSIDSSDPGHGVSLLVEAGRVDAMITTHVVSRRPCAMPAVSCTWGRSILTAQRRNTAKAPSTAV